MKATLSNQLASKLENSAVHIALTTDIWTSLANEAYLSFTASYVDQDGTIKSPILVTVNLGECHTQAAIAKKNLGKVAPL